MKMPKVSVIIPAYNAAALIKRALESVFAQKEDLEVIVVDDCSTDDTIAVVENLHDRRVKVLRQSENKGPAAARNRGLAVATGKYCAFLDGDDYWESDFLKETTSFLDGHLAAVAVSVMQCHKIIGKEATIVPMGTDITEPVLLEDFFEFWKRYNHVCTGSALFKADVARQIGGQREDLRICEDLEFWAMLALYGKWGFIPKVLFTSDGGAVTRTQGWLQKNLIRWNNAPSFPEWRRRLDKKRSENNSLCFEHALGKIARNLCYCHIMAGKDTLARQEVQDFGKFFPKNKVNTLFRMMATFGMTWQPWCKYLRFREYHRSI